MSFARRQIDVQFDLDHAAFPGESSSLSLTGYRALATISTVQDAGSLAVKSLALRIYGMKLADMNALSVWQPSVRRFRTIWLPFQQAMSARR
ncbi:hypothetical protein [Paraburkholderia heleia]|uniref:hypothetical protein n=1 Tax=Paraburkholderia heleia TaxID=634127 RepID=UPI002AB6FE13|nr:hypothetical protein [Paraburkholderia heleia]